MNDMCSIVNYIVYNMYFFFISSKVQCLIYIVHILYYLLFKEYLILKVKIINIDNGFLYLLSTKSKYKKIKKILKNVLILYKLL